MGFFRDFAEKAQKEIEEKENRKKELDKQGVVYCPKCLSTQITANRKGFGLGKAVTGGIIAGPVGLLGGCIGKNKIKCTCLNCGNTFNPGQKF